MHKRNANSKSKPNYKLNTPYGTKGNYSRSSLFTFISFSVKQKEERAEQLDEMARVASEPFARAADDVAMNAHLRTIELADDPMLAYMQSKKIKKQMIHGLG